MTITFSNSLIDSISGSVCKDSPYYYRHQTNGKTILCRKPTCTAKMQKAMQSTGTIQRQERFRKMTQVTQEILQTSALRAIYEARYRKEAARGLSLRNFIMHVISQEKLI